MLCDVRILTVRRIMAVEVKKLGSGDSSNMMYHVNSN